MGNHVPMCGLPDWAPIGDRECDCDLIARVVDRERSNMDAYFKSRSVEWEASVRADERAKFCDCPAAFTRYKATHEAEVRERLRARVEALEDAGCRRVVGGCDCRRSQALRDVLALLGSDDD